ncbi:energy-coupled thiamine transporter ThiT [Spiroplasma floricola]|uniref:Thiamine transporter n=1 Tax=Spiroplasma floricola 23-6 TaxID=1336749 RepID=A0A2K8SD36_9MOLU|nr:energy-coupled thiamine transporter ThiT [Spiroplasma floricola]AUB31352.1 hypothetical protein SFLOR_v1c02950 [Spiroplasma floricola 23-6]
MNKNTIKLTICLSTIRILLFLALIVWAIISVIKVGSEGAKMPIGKNITVSICFSLFFILFVLMNISLILNIIFDSLNVNNKIVIALSIITLNIETMIIYLKKVNFKKISLKMQKWTAFDITSIALLLALYFAIGFVSSLIPPMPFYITISFKYIPLFFGAFILPLSGCITLCFLSATLTALMPGSYLAFWQFLFDYWIPTFCLFVAYFFAPNIKSNKWMNKITIWFAFITIPILIIYFSRVISGVIYWLNPNKVDVWKEFDWTNNIEYSFIYNSFNSIFDYVLLMICVPTVCESLWVIKERFFYRNLNN